MPKLVPQPIIIFMNQKLHLFKLSKNEDLISSLLTKILNLEEKMKNDNAVRLSQLEIDSQQTMVDSTKGKIAALEQTVSEKIIRREQIESVLYSGKVTNGKELKELELESASLLCQITDLEQEQYDVLCQLEKTEEELLAAKAHFDDVVEKRNNDNWKAAREIEGHKKRLIDLESEKNTIVNQLEPEVLSLYQELKSKKNGRALSEVIDSACSICGAELPPSELQKSRMPDMFSYCPSCGRLLFAN